MKIFFSLEVLKNIYKLVAQNLAKAHKRCDSSCCVHQTKLQLVDLVLIKNHTVGPFDLTYIGNY